MRSTATQVFAGPRGRSGHENKGREPAVAEVLERIVGGLARRAGIANPRVEVTAELSAAAIVPRQGAPDNVILVPSCALGRLGERELTGMLAHEIPHLRHPESLAMRAAIACAGVLACVAGGACLATLVGMRRGRVFSVALGALIALTAAGMAAPVFAMARSREYRADEFGARLAEDPQPLVLALEKLRVKSGDSSDEVEHDVVTSPVVARLISGTLGPTGLLSTHPPMEERIQRLREMVGSGEGTAPLPSGA